MNKNCYCIFIYDKIKTKDGNHILDIHIADSQIESRIIIDSSS